jgi:hypothetical protein
MQRGLLAVLVTVVVAGIAAAAAYMTGYDAGLVAGGSATVAPIVVTGGGPRRSSRTWSSACPRPETVRAVGTDRPIRPVRSRPLRDRGHSPSRLRMWDTSLASRPPEHMRSWIHCMSGPPGSTPSR